MNQLSIDFHAPAARRIGAEAGDRCRAKADDVCPGFSERARNFIEDFSRQHAQFTGEECTNAAKMAGIRPHDDRAFGPVYAKALRDGVVRIVGMAARTKGHGSAGGKIYARAFRD